MRKDLNTSPYLPPKQTLIPQNTEPLFTSTYIERILTDMKKLLLTLDDDMAKELAKYPNRSETLREAFRIYNGHISTDTVVGLRASYKQLWNLMEGKFEVYDAAFARLDKLISVLETRM